eukprot:7318562-Pyramimonas_sp.AAC.1
MAMIEMDNFDHFNLFSKATRGAARTFNSRHLLGFVSPPVGVMAPVVIAADTPDTLAATLAATLAPPTLPTLSRRSPAPDADETNEIDCRFAAVGATISTPGAGTSCASSSHFIAGTSCGRGGASTVSTVTVQYGESTVTVAVTGTVTTSCSRRRQYGQYSNGTVTVKRAPTGQYSNSTVKVTVTGTVITSCSERRPPVTAGAHRSVTVQYSDSTVTVTVKGTLTGTVTTSCSEWRPDRDAIPQRAVTVEASSDQAVQDLPVNRAGADGA